MSEENETEAQAQAPVTATDSIELAPLPEGMIYTCDPVTGKRKAVEAATAVAVEPETAPAGEATAGQIAMNSEDPIQARISKLKRALTRKERGQPNTYVSTFTYDDRVIFLKDELDNAGYKRYVQTDQRVVSDLQKLAEDSTNGKVSGEEAARRSEELLDARIANNEAVLLATIGDWEFPDEATPEEIRALPNSAKANLAMLIARQSRMSEIEGTQLQKK